MAKLNGPTPKFTSRYADPNNPASNGNLFSLLSGGLINTGPPLGTKGSQLGGGLLGNRGGGFGRQNSGGLFGRRQQDDYDSDYQRSYQQQGYYDEQGYYHQAHSTQHQNEYQRQGMGRQYSNDSDRGGFGGNGGPLDGLVGAILGPTGGSNPIKRILKKVSAISLRVFESLMLTCRVPECFVSDGCQYANGAGACCWARIRQKGGGAGRIAYGPKFQILRVDINAQGFGGL